MKPMNEEHFAILRRHMIDVIRIHTDRMSDELGTEALQERVLSAMLQVPRHTFVPRSIGLAEGSDDLPALM
jgi:protein-L-isoaspartate(D-aspartate) O-methyltransferase